MVAFNSESLSKLCSADQLELLNSIDRLRLQGINNYVSLPQIIVCGDQSSGKSSVLEAISGVSFPKSSSLCTRFPTELVLRRGPHVSASISIIPHASRGESEDKALRGFKESLTNFEDLPKIIESAKLAMGLSTLGKAFSNDILRIELTSPDHPHLTIVDLPGLIHSETKHQSASDVELIKEIVQGYMKEPRCVILAVISAKNDFANQVVLSLARSIDKTGHRTLGVITKPDTLKSGSQSEADFVSLARNQHVVFRLGWHVLKNMDSEHGSTTLKERDAKEANFFAQGAWTELPHGSLGIQRLRTRLSKVLLGQIASELPSLLDEINDKFATCQSQLVKLGKPRITLAEQRLYLFSFVEQFQSLAKSAVDGTYNHPFFLDPKLDKGYQQRIRAVVQNLNDEFSAEMQQKGHYREVAAEPPNDYHGSRNIITRELFIKHIEQLLHRTRGRELPGMFNSMIVANLFLEQSRPWEGIVNSHVQKVGAAARSFLGLVSAYLADGDTDKAMQQEVFGPAMETVLSEMKAKTAEILAPHKAGHPITYDDSFVQELQSVRRQRLEESTSKVIAKFFKVQDCTQILQPYTQVNCGQLVKDIVAGNEPNVNRAGAEDALDCLNAYYKVSTRLPIRDSLHVWHYNRVPVAEMSPSLLCVLLGCAETIHRRRCC